MSDVDQLAAETRYALKEVRAEMQTVIIGLTEAMTQFFIVAVDVGQIDRAECAKALMVGMEGKTQIARSIVGGIAAAFEAGQSPVPPTLTVIKGDKD